MIKQMLGVVITGEISRFKNSVRNNLDVLFAGFLLGFILISPLAFIFGLIAGAISF